MTQNSSLLQWLATFRLDGKNPFELKEDAYYNLADGFVCARILNQIAPNYFTDKWLEGIKPVPPDGSWLLRVSNLKRILQKIDDYASDLQSPQFRLNEILPDVAVIAQNFNHDQIGRLIQLILFCAINCDKKQEYIERIRILPTQVKQDIKEAIEELLVRDDHSYQRLNASQHNTSRGETSSSARDSSTNNVGPKNPDNLNESSIYSPITTPNRNVTVSRGQVRRNSSQLSSDTSKIAETSSQSLYDDPSDNVEDIKRRLNAALVMKDEKAQACHELEIKLRQMQLEKEHLVYENEKLLKDNMSNKLVSSPTRIQSASRNAEVSRNDIFKIKDNEDDIQNTALHKNLNKLQKEIASLKEQLIKTEAEKEEFRLKATLLKEDMDKMSFIHDELKRKADQARRLQDELDEHRQVVEKAANYETTIENLVKRNNDIKKELKTIEEKNLANIHKIVKLEEENNQLQSITSQIEIYKKQLHDAQIKLSEEAHRADKAEVELIRLSEKYTNSQRENEKLHQTANQLMRINSYRVEATSTRSSEIDSKNLGTFDSTNPNNSQTLNAIGAASPQNHDQASSEALTSLPNHSVVELKERVARLEYENEILKDKINSKKENDQSALGLFESANAKSVKLEVDNRQLRKKVLLLEGRLKDLSTLPNNTPQTSTHNVLAPNDSSSDNTLALMNRVEELQRILFQKEHELMESESKYKKNLQKAKEVIKALNNNQSLSNSLHPSCMSSSSFNSTSLDEVNVLKQQVKDREDRIIELEREFYEFKKLKEIHERLVISAFYGLTTPMQRKNADRRLERTTLTSPPNTAASSMNHSKHSH